MRVSASARPRRGLRSLNVTIPGLLLRQRQVAGLAHDLAHPRMPEEVRVDGRGLAHATVRRRPQRQDAHARALRGRAHDTPRLRARHRPAMSIFIVHAGVEQRLVVAQSLLPLEGQQGAGQVRLARRQKHALHRPAGVLAVGQHQTVAAHVRRP